MGNGNNVVNFDKKGVASYGELTEMDINKTAEAADASAAASATESVGKPKGKTPPPAGSFDFTRFMTPKAAAAPVAPIEEKQTTLPNPGDTAIPTVGEETEQPVTGTEAIPEHVPAPAVEQPTVEEVQQPAAVDANAEAETDAGNDVEEDKSAEPAFGLNNLTASKVTVTETPKEEVIADTGRIEELKLSGTIDVTKKEEAVAPQAAPAPVEIDSGVSFSIIPFEEFLDKYLGGTAGYGWLLRVLGASVKFPCRIYTDKDESALRCYNLRNRNNGCWDMVLGYGDEVTCCRYDKNRKSYSDRSANIVQTSDGLRFKNEDRECACYGERKHPALVV